MERVQRAVHLITRDYFHSLPTLKRLLNFLNQACRIYLVWILVWSHSCQQGRDNADIDSTKVITAQSVKINHQILLDPITSYQIFSLLMYQIRSTLTGPTKNSDHKDQTEPFQRDTGTEIGQQPWPDPGSPGLALAALAWPWQPWPDPGNPGSSLALQLGFRRAAVWPAGGHSSHSSGDKNWEIWSIAVLWRGLHNGPQAWLLHSGQQGSRGDISLTIM